MPAVKVSDQRTLFESAVVDRLKESGFLEIEIRTECLVRCDGGYQDEVINAGWHYWNASLASALTLKDDPGNGVEAELVKALERLASMEGMTGSFYRKDNAEGLELLARIKFAEAALSQYRKGSEDNG
ncbi:hypothetical protein [Rhizobium leguminosarum]|uniref:hypothetical protein n=1 Tax=Rhizobium leguminosarum TaxID=384 RepID=UPI0012375EAA|nr:hypothetical protein [Rhizobium leguminosarum]